MSEKFIPEGDSPFNDMAGSFASTIAGDPRRFGLSEEDAQLLTRRVKDFQAASMRHYSPRTKTKRSRLEKDETRKRAEVLIRKFANMIRADDRISASDKVLLRIKERVKKNGTRPCPQRPPQLRFIQSQDESAGGGGKHVLEFRDTALEGGKRAKPEGADRIQLFVELIAPDEAIPTQPGELSGGRLWYLGSFKKNPMVVEFPVPASPMWVVYWARWEGSNCDTGPFSKTCVARVEGVRRDAPALTSSTRLGGRTQRIVITSARRELPDLSPRNEETQDALSVVNG